MMQAQMQEYLAYCHQIEDYLAQSLKRLPPHGYLEKAMEYSLMAGGKRVRPVLTLATCQLFGGKAEEALPFAAAVEMIHTYSLIHDDLPAMDNDDLRRGKATCHKAFDESTAILAGDALLTGAFFQLANAKLHPQKIVAATLSLSSLAGAPGMVGGQALDLGITPSTLEQVEEIQTLKTGALLIASCHLGAIAAGVGVEEITTITNYASCLGRAFQIRDDILDATGEEASLGKPIGSDKRGKKENFFTLYGLEKANQEVETLTKQAKESVAKLPNSGFLLWLVDHLATRNK